jgi:hypothetical protein
MTPPKAAVVLGIGRITRWSSKTEGIAVGLCAEQLGTADKRPLGLKRSRLRIEERTDYNPFDGGCVGAVVTPEGKIEKQ